jgi:citrate lyase subunit beta/citryl-CoA lyase
MTSPIHPRRSVLYVPADNARAIEKARGLAADALIFDLEDAVTPDHKEAARGQVLAALAGGAYGRRELIVRTNALDTAWGRSDLTAVAKSGADGVLLPKVDNAATVKEAEALLTAAGAPADLAIWCMIETPRGVLRAEAIADSGSRVACLVAGTVDLAKDLNASADQDRLALIPSLAHILLAARAAGLACLDSVYLDIRDDEGFEAECRQGALMGFDGKTLIHPRTIEIANRIFSPSDAELDEARRIIAAHEAALAAGKSVAVVDGKLVEHLHVGAAQRLLDLAAQIALFIEEAGFSP